MQLLSRIELDMNDGLGIQLAKAIFCQIPRSWSVPLYTHVRKRVLGEADYDTTLACLVL